MSTDLLPAATVDSTGELLIQPSIRDASNEALAGDDIIGRITRLDLSRLMIYDIDHVAAEALPFLMQQFSRMGWDGWEFAETDAERRAMIKGAIRYHRLKGTLAGFRAAAWMARSSIVRAIQPPAKIYMGPALTVAERNVFLRRYPQLRLYPYRTRGVRVGMMGRGSFCGRGDLAGDGKAAWCFPEITDAVTRMADVGYMERGGVETKLFTIVRENNLVEVRSGATAYQAKFCGRLLGRDYPYDMGAAARIYRTRFTGPYAYTGETLHQRTVTPGLDPIEIKYEVVFDQGQAVGVFLGARKTEQCKWYHVARWTVDHRAGDRIYKRWYLFDPEVPLIKRGASLFVGAQRFGMPAFHAELLTSIPGVVTRRIMGRYVAGCLPTGQHTKLDRTMNAFRAVTRFADRVKVNTATHGPIRCGTVLRAGSDLVCGQFVPN